jgi:hypothetical protein
MNFIKRIASIKMPILFIIAAVLIVLQVFLGRMGMKDAASYKEKYEVAISQRDYYKRLYESESNFQFEAFLPDGMSIAFRADYQADYSMTVDKRLAITCSVKNALADETLTRFFGEIK